MKTPRLPRTRRGHHVPPWRRAKLATGSDRVANISRDVLSVESMREFVERGRKAQEAVDDVLTEHGNNMANSQPSAGRQD